MMPTLLAEGEAEVVENQQHIQVCAELAIVV